MSQSEGVRIRHNRGGLMDNTITSYEYTNSVCSIRSLATLFIAWICAVVIASIMMRVRYIWITLTVVTFIFVLACGYVACNARRVRESYAGTEDSTRTGTHRRERSIETVAGRLDNNYPTEPPTYQTVWVADLPPSYSSSVSHPATVTPHLIASEQLSPSMTLSSPPPYSVAVATNTNTIHTSVPNQHMQLLRGQSCSTSMSCNEEKQSGESEQTFVTNNRYASNIIGYTIVTSRREGDNTDPSNSNASTTTQ